ncbi:MAG: Smr/MutS family protein [Candidatus Eisenbacteria bacterium]|nr:Smr/MutS family protein [Candidatus Eisenbacteria bacterium]
MKTKECEVCGNEIPLDSLRCRFCGSQQRGQRWVAAPREKIRTVNLKAGMPTVEEGLERLICEIHRARQSEIKLLRIIHGWGSSGRGGKLRNAVRRFLQDQLKAKRIRSCLAGDKFARDGAAGSKLLADYPELRRTQRTDIENPGITFVEL